MRLVSFHSCTHELESSESRPEDVGKGVNRSTLYICCFTVQAQHRQTERFAGLASWRRIFTADPSFITRRAGATRSDRHFDGTSFAGQPFWPVLYVKSGRCCVLCFRRSTATMTRADALAAAYGGPALASFRPASPGGARFTCADHSDRGVVAGRRLPPSC